MILLLSGFVRREATLRTDLNTAAQAAGVEGQDVIPDYGRLLATLTNPSNSRRCTG